MNTSSLWISPFKKIPSDIKSDLTFLSSVPIFDSLSQRQLFRIHKLIHIRNYESGEVVFRQGDPGVGMYIVRSGQIEVYSEHADMTREKIAVMNPGDFFGDISLLNDSARSATAVASRKSTLFGFFRPDLLSLMDSDPKLGMRFIYRLAQIVAERLRLSSVEN